MIIIEEDDDEVVVNSQGGEGPQEEEELTPEEQRYRSAAELMESVDCVARYERAVISLNAAADLFDKLVDYKDSRNRFFVRTSSDKNTVEQAFGSVKYVDAGIDGEIGFTTEEMTEGEFMEREDKIDIIGRIRLG